MEAASSSADIYMQFAVYDLVGALFAPSDPQPVSRSADKLFARICGVVKDGFSDPDFGPAEVASRSGDFAALRPEAVSPSAARHAANSSIRIGWTMPHICLHRRALNGHRPASQRDRLRLRLSRLCAFRAGISQAVWLFAGCLCARTGLSGRRCARWYRKKCVPGTRRQHFGRLSFFMAASVGRSAARTRFRP